MKRSWPLFLVAAGILIFFGGLAYDLMVSLVGSSGRLLAGLGPAPGNSCMPSPRR